MYKKYFTLDYTQFLTGVEKSYIKEHGGIRIGFLDNDSVVFSMDKKSGEIRGTLSEYISYAKDCLGNHTLKFDIEAFDDYDKMIEALQNNEIDVIYYASRNSNVAEKKGYALSNTAWTYNLIAVTNKEDFNEKDSYVVAVPKNKVALKQHIAYNYPHWKLVDCDSIEDGANMVDNGKVDCFIMGSSQVLSFDGKKNFKIIPLTKTMEACFAVKDGQATLLSILNKTIKAMPSDMLTSAIAMYDSTAYKTTFYSFLKDHLVVVLVLGFSIIIVILLLLQKARRAEASAKVALKSAEDASLAKTQFLHNVSHDIRTPMNAILGYSELMKNELKDNDLPKVFEHLNKLQKAGNILLSIITNELSFVPKKEELKVNGIVLGYPFLTPNSEEFSSTHQLEGVEKVQDIMKYVLYQTNVPSEEQLSKVDLYNYISENSVPMFIWHSIDDSVVDSRNSTRFISKLLEYNVPVEYHLFGHGEHGKALENQLTHMDDADIDLHLNMWVNMADYWMKRMGGK